MLSSSKRGAAIAPETLVKLILLSAFLLIIIGLIIMVQRGVSAESAQKYSCWLSSSLKSSDSFLKGDYPDTSQSISITDPLDIKGVSVVLRDTWWQYGQGEADYSVVSGSIYEAVKFKVSAEVSLKDLLQYLLTHKKGVSSSMQSSDYNFLQNKADGPTVCFDKKFVSEGLAFKPGEDYYVYFSDSALWDALGFKSGFFKSQADRLFVMKSRIALRDLTKEGAFVCYRPLSEVIASGEALEEISNE